MGGTAYIKVVAGGPTPDSVLVTVVGQAQFSWTSSQLGKGQYQQNVYISTPNNVVAPLTITLANSATRRPFRRLTIPTGTYYQYHCGRPRHGRRYLHRDGAGVPERHRDLPITSPRSARRRHRAADVDRARTSRCIRDSIGNSYNRSAPQRVADLHQSGGRDRDSTRHHRDRHLLPQRRASRRRYRRRTSSTPGHRAIPPSSPCRRLLSFSFTSALVGHRQYFTTTNLRHHTRLSRHPTR